eukprot:gnl/Dysnectes_brevis/2680_a3245_1072.p2 GENE.gnl/Dysnectes_brevis/2680_a3245_1072~~gnl/Dysnectes_brevis/2680_a3245_1072.p2  ORF type:complete len:220 (-),score=16.54 gnl/Dysnectes_brevis/2680_a3245_1072:811-1470(-)
MSSEGLNSSFGSSQHIRSLIAALDTTDLPASNYEDGPSLRLSPVLARTGAVIPLPPPGTSGSPVRSNRFIEPRSTDCIPSTPTRERRSRPRSGRPLSAAIERIEGGDDDAFWADRTAPLQLEDVGSILDRSHPPRPANPAPKTPAPEGTRWDPDVTRFGTPTISQQLKSAHIHMPDDSDFNTGPGLPHPTSKSSGPPPLVDMFIPTKSGLSDYLRIKHD